MDPTISIRPSKDLRNNYAQISALAKEHPVAITVNGREDTVLIGHDLFMKQQRRIAELEEILALYDELDEGEADVINGRTHSEEEAREILHQRIIDRDDSVFMGYGKYVNQQNRIAELEELTALLVKIIRADNDIKNGNVFPADVVFDTVIKELEERDNEKRSPDSDVR